MAIARAIVSDPTLLVCDEPTGDLDRATADEILTLLQMLNREHGKTIVMVTHDPKAAEYARRQLHLDKGTLGQGWTRAADERYCPLLWAGLFRRKTRTVLTLAVGVRGLPALRSAAGRPVAFESGADSADAKRLLTTARYSIIEPLPMSLSAPDRAGAGRGRRGPRRVVRRQVPEREQRVPRLRRGPPALPRHVPGVHRRARAAGGLRQDAHRRRRGQRLVDRFGWKVGQKLPIASEIHPRADGDLNWEFDLVGILDADDPAVRGNTDVVLINVAYFDEARQLGKGKTGWYIVRIADAGQARAIAADIDRRFMNSPDETKTQPEKEFAIGFAKQIGDMGALVTRILAAVFFTILHPDRQHHGPVHPGARSRAGHPEDARLLRRQGHGARAGGGALLLLLGGGLGMGAAVGCCPS